MIQSRQSLDPTTGHHLTDAVETLLSRRPASESERDLAWAGAD